ncbi:ArsR/SmtB family transcription factor [Allonocardiopsis opalescens]|uniref:ArsR family transcriptional regulator n=1 Tax=Allonocardiopsis opalescens TaxID=1144618 RepID=A0A2T0QES0_9ACTN|nr:metalloregulator ArsR/SmtB family transcription factor [Allonocardiopsis opalescens]PRY02395.1 ArsR family transcriptional regulator [Allonocardiopsis opalescens]
MLISARDPVAEAAVALFGDPLRARIVALLATEQMCTCHLIEETGARQPTVSHHLRVLREAGLVDTEPKGRFTYYRLRAEAVAELADALGGLADRAERAGGHYRPC